MQNENSSLDNSLELPETPAVIADVTLSPSRPQPPPSSANSPFRFNKTALIVTGVALLAIIVITVAALVFSNLTGRQNDNQTNGKNIDDFDMLQARYRRRCRRIGPPRHRRSARVPRRQRRAPSP